MENPNTFDLPFGEDASFEMDLADYRSDYHQLIQSRAVAEPSEIEQWVGKPISEQSIRDCLRYFYKDQPIGIVLYFFEDDQLRVWLLNQQGLQYRGETAVTASRIRELSEGLSSALKIRQFETNRAARHRSLDLGTEEEPEEVPDLDEVLQHLSRILFPEGLGQSMLAQELQHLIIVPALSIQQLPFAILRPFWDHTLMIDQWSYSIAASIYDIAKLTLRKKTPKSTTVHLNPAKLQKERLLFVGNPLFTSAGEWFLPNLPGAEEEVRMVAKRMSAASDQVLIGQEATLPLIKQKVGAAQVIYFATHGISDPSQPLDGGGLFFTPTSEHPLGFWSAREIQEEELTAALVILSACQTGLGQSQDAGIIGLSRAFHLAGAENIIMSLWSVDDTATNNLMQLFMEQLQKPHRFFPSEPLRQAMLTYRRQYPEASPLFWASFSTLGIPY